MFKQTYPRAISSVSRIMQDIETELTQRKIPTKRIARILLLTEESVVSFIENVSQKAESGLEICIRRRLGDLSIRIAVEGEEYDPSMQMHVPGDHALDMAGSEIQTLLHSRILQAFGSEITYAYKNKRNILFITIKKSEQKSLYLTLGAFAMAIVVGILLQLAGNPALTQGLSTYLFSPIKTMFLNALSMVMVPVVFFSLVSCISDLSNVSDLGRIGSKTVMFYLFTSVCAIFIGIGAYCLLQPGATASMTLPVSETQSASQVEQVDISILQIIIDVVPKNIVTAFEEANMLQVIFIAVLCGLAVGAIGERGKVLRDIFTACNDLFLRITRMIITFVPLVTFCAITALISTSGAQVLQMMTGLAGTVILGLVFLVILYSLLILLVAHENPFAFLRKFGPNTLLTFALSSSNAAMPSNLDCCQKKLGISSKIASFSIPLGATINMDGTCIYLSVASLLLANIYGVDITGSTLVTLLLSILMLSIGAPGVSGSALICLSTLVVQLGIPVESVALFMGVDQILSMFRAAANSTGDAAVSVVVAKLENLLDTTVFRGK